MLRFVTSPLPVSASAVGHHLPLSTVTDDCSFKILLVAG